jgi:glucose-6-phosphate 1-dehydrogenase
MSLINKQMRTARRHCRKNEELRPMKTNDQLEPTVFAIFGGMGDLTWRKLVPALFDLSQDRSLPCDFSIIAVDRIQFNEEKLRRRLHDGTKKFSRQGNVKAGEWSKFASHIHYQQGDFKKLQTYMALGSDSTR